MVEEKGFGLSSRYRSLQNRGLIPLRFTPSFQILCLNMPLAYLNLKTKYLFKFYTLWWRRKDLNLCRHTPADLQSAPFDHSGTPPRYSLVYVFAKWSRRTDLNGQPADYKSAALPIELRRQNN
jgi:hypothetical protein